MSLLPRPADTELLRMKAEREAHVVNGVRVGPDSPLLKGKAAKPQPVVPQRKEIDPLDPDAKMNRTEYSRAVELEAKRRAGHIAAWYFGKVALRLATSTFYHTDFFIVERSGAITIEETKGRWYDDARVKIKVAATNYPHFNFLALRKRKKKEGGGWDMEHIKP